MQAYPHSRSACALATLGRLELAQAASRPGDYRVRFLGITVRQVW